MSSIPGYTLEAYVMWEHNLIVDGDTSANWSLQAVEALGQTTVRQNRRLTGEQFKHVLTIYEPHRALIEGRLLAFDEEKYGWRQYYSDAFHHMPDGVLTAADATITALLVKTD